MSCEISMPEYQCHKRVWALQIKKVVGNKISWVDPRYAAIEFPSDMFIRYQPKKYDYMVVYRGGYKSFSPRKEFEEGYTAL